MFLWHVLIDSLTFINWASLTLWSVVRVCGDSTGDILWIRWTLHGPDWDRRGVQLGRRRFWKTGPWQQWKAEKTQTDRGPTRRRHCSGRDKPASRSPNKQNLKLKRNQFNFLKTFMTFLSLPSSLVVFGTQLWWQQMGNCSPLAVVNLVVWVKGQHPTRCCLRGWLL